MVLRRLAGQTAHTAPVLTLVTQFGGGKTHTLTALYHLAKAGADAAQLPGVVDILSEAGMAGVPPARVGVFAGNAWDPVDGRETPWIDLARQLAGDEGVAALGTAARTAPPGTEALAKVFAAARAPVLLLFDEVLNFVNRHRNMAESFHAFIQNLIAGPTAWHQAPTPMSGEFFQDAANVLHCRSGLQALATVYSAIRNSTFFNDTLAINLKSRALAMDASLIIHFLFSLKSRSSIGSSAKVILLPRFYYVSRHQAPLFIVVFVIIHRHIGPEGNISPCCAVERISLISWTSNARIAPVHCGNLRHFICWQGQAEVKVMKFGIYRFLT